ncbi:MAG: hypothetical protein KGR47_07100 [Acidobacteria bacterium]|nr:hypothetical protein [Acidobacteriota bacterium]
MSGRTRSLMVRELVAADRQQPQVAGGGFGPQDATGLAVLMLEAYRGTVDDEGETLHDANNAVEALFAGQFGVFDAEASVAFRGESGFDAATVVTEHGGTPLLAFSMTHPCAVRRGLARMGLHHAIGVLARAGRGELRLVVTDTNDRAMPLYLSEGFHRLGS